MTKEMKTLKKQAAAPEGALTISRPELLVNGSDRQFRRLVDDLFAFAARHQEIRDGHAARIGLTGVEYSTLIALKHLTAVAVVGVNDLAAHLHVSGSFVTTVVGKLIRRGLVAKRPGLDDKRRVRLTLTPKGFGLLAKLAPVQRQVNNVEFGPLSSSDFQKLLSILAQLIESSDRALALQKYLAMHET